MRRVAAVAVGAGLLAACAAAGRGSATTSAVETTVRGPGTGSAFCTMEAALRSLKGPLDGSTTRPSPASVRQYFESVLPPRLAALESAAPNAIHADVRTVAEGFAAAASMLRDVGWDLAKATSNPAFDDLLGAARYQDASDRIDVFCGLLRPTTTTTITTHLTTSASGG